MFEALAASSSSGEDEEIESEGGSKLTASE